MEESVTLECQTLQSMRQSAHIRSTFRSHVPVIVLACKGLLTVSDADAGGRQGRSCSLAFPSSEPPSPSASAGRPGQPAPLRLEPAGPSAAGDLNQVGLYRLLTNAMLDRELQHTYRVTIRCTDTGEPPLSTTLEFQLIVLVRVLMLIRSQLQDTDY